MAIEDLEYGRRKIQTVFIGIAGFIIMVLGLPVIIRTGSFVGVLMNIGGGIIIVYAGYLWRKVTHVVWTKQAIREMWDKQQKAESEYYRINSEARNRVEVTQDGNIYIDDTFIDRLDKNQLYAYRKGYITDEDIIRYWGHEGFCPHCDKAVKPDDMFCPHCGKELVSQCPHCGSEIDENANFCPKCGQKLMGNDI